MTQQTNPTVTPVVLVARAGNEAVEIFGPFSHDCTLLAFDEVATGQGDEALRGSRFVGIGTGGGQVEALRHVLWVLGADAGDDVTIALQVRADAQHVESEVARVVSEYPGFEFVGPGVRTIGSAQCVQIVRTRAWGQGSALPEVFVPSSTPVTKDTDLDEFVHGAATVQLRSELAALRQDNEDVRTRLSRVRRQLQESRRRAKSLRVKVDRLQNQITRLHQSRWWRLGHALDGASQRVAGRLHVTRRVLAAMAGVVGLALFASAVASVLLLDGWEVGDGLTLVGLVAVPTLLVLFALVLRRQVVLGVGHVSGQVGSLRRTIRHADRRVAHSQKALAGLETTVQDEGVRTRESVEQRLDRLGDEIAEIAGRIAEPVPAGERDDAEPPAWFRQFEQRHNRRMVLERREAQAAMNLFALSPAKAPVPYMGGWAASPDVLLLLVEELLELRPKTVVEFGSGVSTLWLAKVIAQHSMDTKLVALEHEATYREKTIETLRLHGVESVAEVRHAPLKPRNADDEVPWYDTDCLRDLHDVGLVFVDGPPQAVGDLARMPAVPELKGRLASNCSILLDDLVRAEEKKIAAAWRAELEDFSYEEVPLEKGCAAFRRRT